ncbi:phosphotransferase family protein [Sandaracinobacteroides hominis]|uniref:phosphotransferase family protein n=1 Tax=Sandaracinobacteroides hominis TaxID=2780086 RepID=UPI0018F3976B|nr:phosphotransferase family protein [Sandaracinobacteroides hominis]
MPEHDLIGRLEAVLSAQRGTPVRVDSLSRFHGGAARETWRFVAHMEGGSEGLVVRRDPSSSLITTSRSAEYHVLRRAHSAGIPAPEPLLLDLDGRQFGSPGFLMREVPGGRAASPLDENPYGDTRAETGRGLFDALGRLHALTPDAADRDQLPVQDAAGRLAHWKAEIAAHATGPEPVAAAALRWLEANIPPASGPPSLVHGDFRSGNFLVDAGNRLLAILDWEMAHVGDPYEDLAWVTDPLWGHAMPGHPAGTLPFDEAISIWEAASGRRFDAGIFRWWQLFSAYQGLAIWISSSFEVANMRTVDPVMAFAGLYPYRAHNADLARLLMEVAK